MSNANTFVTNYAQQIQNLINTLETLRTMNDQLVQDPTLITRYFAQTAPTPPVRTDIVAADISNAQSAMVQMLFTFDSSSPTQKSYLFKMLP